MGHIEIDRLTNSLDYGSISLIISIPSEAEVGSGQTVPSNISSHHNVQPSFMRLPGMKKWPNLPAKPDI